jgi:hypothetical protein
MGLKDKKKDKILTGNLFDLSVDAALTGKEKRMLNLHPVKNGEIRNPKGKSVGTKNFKTLYEEALIELGKKNKKNPKELELEIIAKGVAMARGGNYQFYKDLLDRVHGTAIQNNANIDIKHEDVSTEIKEKIDDLLRKIF